MASWATCKGLTQPQHKWCFMQGMVIKCHGFGIVMEFLREPLRVCAEMLPAAKQACVGVVLGVWGIWPDLKLTST